MNTTKILLQFDPEINNLLPALKKISAAFGYISKNEAEKVADYFSVPLSKVFETASFYDLIKTKIPPEFLIQVCSSANCSVNYSSQVIKEIENYFRIKCGDKNNPKVVLEEISCLGRCGEGPVVVVNGKIYTNITPVKVHGILEEISRR